MSAQILYALVWASFGLVHSLLARPAARQWLERAAVPFHRLTYSLIAVAHFSFVLGLGSLLLTDQDWYEAPAILRWPFAGVALIGALIVLLATGQHDVGTFLGWRQVIDHCRGQTDATAETLRVGGLYRYCRHPAYLGTLLCFWGLAVNPLGLATAVWVTVYTLIGMRLEERDLLGKFGADYEAYQREVPMLIPSFRPHARG
jgi:protein-S-isoprenylcysteine O-methyltransferase Ste14